MKLGILTYHRSDNFGALFQAIASRYYLESLGHEVYYINYWPNYHKAMYAPFSWWLFWRFNLRGKYQYLKKSWKKRHENIERKKRFSKFVRENIKPYYAPCRMTFDAIFYGSDQIWRKQPYIEDYNPVYFAHGGYKAKRHIALSASAGILPITVEDKEKFKTLLNRFDSISVREDSLKDLLETFNYKATLTCDPALFLTTEQWDNLFPRSNSIKSKYLLFVNYIEDSFDIESVKDLAISKGLEYVCIDGSAIQRYQIDDMKNTAPLLLFDYIRNASFICTSSFHALVFSLIYHKQFFAAFKNNAKRAESLLEALGIGDRLLKHKAEINSTTRVIDYKEIDLKLDIIREETFRFINSSLI